MEKFLKLTAWTMSVPKLYGPFHIITAAVGVAAFAAAFFFARKIKGAVQRKENGIWEKKGSFISFFTPIDRLYITVGIILLISEIYKQLFNYYLIDGRHYNWYLFPFQLCSLPMYFCLIIPWIKSGKLKTSLNTFMSDFNLMGAVMVFADPSGIFSEYTTLTLHGILWHLIVIIVSLTAGLTGQGDTASLKGFLKTLPVFFISCCTAVAMNILLYPYGGANMFYIDPYTPSVQIVFKDIAANFGIAAGNIAYMAAMIAGAFLCHLAFCFSARGRGSAPKRLHRKK